MKISPLATWRARYAVITAAIRAEKATHRRPMVNAVLTTDLSQYGPVMADRITRNHQRSAERELTLRARSQSDHAKLKAQARQHMADRDEARDLARELASISYVSDDMVA